MTIDKNHWTPLTRHPIPEKLTLLQMMGHVWSFQELGDGRPYSCEVDWSFGSEHWFVMPATTEQQWISPSEAARLLGVSRQAIHYAIASRRLATADCNGRPKICRADVLALTIQRQREQLAKAAVST